MITEHHKIVIVTNNFRSRNRFGGQGEGVKCVGISSLPSIKYLLAILIAINILIKILDSEKAIYPPKPEEEDCLNLYRQMDLYKECDYC